MTDLEQDTPIETIRRFLDCEIVTRGRVVLIGLGGIGSHVARPLGTFLASLAEDPADKPTEIILCDGDSFALENTYRMDIVDFGNKAEVIGRELMERLGGTSPVIRWVTEYVTQQNVAEIIQDGDCVLLACDNHATRNLVGCHCSGGLLKNVVLISGGNDGVEQGLTGTYGNVQIYVRHHEADITAPIDRFHPEIANPSDRRPDELSCAELAIAGAPQLLFTNLAVASGMCNALLRLMTPRNVERMYDEIAIDILDAVSVPHYFSHPANASGELGCSAYPR